MLSRKHRQTIYKNAEFLRHGEKLDEGICNMKAKETQRLSSLEEDVSAIGVNRYLAEDILAEFEHYFDDTSMFYHVL